MIQKIYARDNASLKASYSVDEIVVEDGIKAINIPTSKFATYSNVYDFTESIYLDRSDNPKSLTLVGTPTPSIFDLVPFGKVMHKLEGAGMFIPKLFSADDSKISMAFKFQQTLDTPTDDYIFLLSYDQDNHRIQIYYKKSTTTLYFEYLTSAPAGKNVTYSLSWEAFKTMKDYGITVETNGSNDVTLVAFLDGVQVGTRTDLGVGHKHLNNTARLGCSSGDGTYVEGYFSDLVARNEIMVESDFLELHNNRIYKFKTSAEYEMLEDFTHEQMTSFLSFGVEKLGTGTLGFVASNDEGATDQRWLGSEWGTGGSGYNTAITLNDHISELSNPNKKLRLKIALQSPTGWEEVGFTFNQLGYNLNGKPSVECPPSKEVISGESTNVDGIIISDTDNNLDYGSYQLEGESVVDVLKGSFATLQEAFENLTFDSTGWALGEKLITIVVYDTFGLSATDNMNFLVQEDLTTKIDSILALVTSTDATVDLIKPETDKIESKSSQASIDSLNDFNSATDIVANVTLVDTTTTNTDMRGTDNASLVDADNASISLIKTKTDQIVLIGDRVKSTLDGESVSVDTTGLALEATLQAVKLVVDTNLDEQVSTRATQTTLDWVKDVTDSHLDVFLGNRRKWVFNGVAYAEYTGQTGTVVKTFVLDDVNNVTTRVGQ